MQSNKKTNNRDNSSPIKDVKWLIYKVILIGVAMYICYGYLHLSPRVFHIREILLCICVIIGFAAIIEHHATIKKITDYPDKIIIPSPLTLVGGVLSWLMYMKLLFYGFGLLGTEGWKAVFPIVIFIIILEPNIVIHTSRPFYYLEL